MSDRLTKAEKRYNRADNLLKKSKYAFYVFLVLAASVIAYQLYAIQRNQLITQRQADAQRDEATENARERLTQALAENERLHALTQEYVKCIATVLLKPVDARNPEDFESCSIPVREPTLPAVQNRTTIPAPEPQNQQSNTAPVQQQSPSQSRSEEPTTSGSGSGDEPTDTTAATLDTRACLIFNLLCSRIEVR